MSPTLKRTVKSKKIKVISVCSVCGEPVCATKNDLAYRHGFNRYKKKRTDKTFSQEDDKPCAGSGKKVLYQKR